MSAPTCPSCGRPLGRRLAVCPYCGERIPGAVWRMAALTLVVAPVALLEVAAFSRLGARRFFGVFTALPHMPQAHFWLAVAAVILFAPFPRPRPGTASIGRFRRATAIITRLLVLVFLAQFMCMAVQ